ncbi:MAG: hypothetical protein ACYTE6_13435 [Planctomycetota bacterium]
MTDQGQVLYLAEKRACRRFPKPATPDLFGGMARDFQVFERLDFIAELTQHIPEPNKHLVRRFVLGRQERLAAWRLRRGCARGGRSWPRMSTHGQLDTRPCARTAVCNAPGRTRTCDLRFRRPPSGVRKGRRVRGLRKSP